MTFATFATNLLPKIEAYIAAPAVREACGLATDAPAQLAFLAQGEYNINYLLTSGAQQRVVRVNVGTQIGKAGGAQIAYEAAALALLGPHGVAPTLFYVDDTLVAVPYGLLVMEYLPGGPLRYDDSQQIAAAAHTLARLHRVPLPPETPFIHRRPLLDDLEEARGWLASYLDCPRVPAAQRARFATLLARAADAAARHADRFPTPVGLVHTDVQAHNFIVHTSPGSAHTLDCRLVDWERPLIDDPTYDLAHFLIPTTTRWKCGYTFSDAEQAHFLNAYCAARPDLEPQELRERLRLRLPFILLRAISWCASAWVEYTDTTRTIANMDTLARIEEYLQPAALAALFPAWLPPEASGSVQQR